MDLHAAIGKNGKLPWDNLPKDMAYFKKITEGHPVIMGRKTWDSIPDRFKPLVNRTNIVISRTLSRITHDKTYVESSLPKAIRTGLSIDNEIFIIGGAEIYKASMPFVDRIYRTVINTTIPDTDTFFSRPNEDQWHLSSSTTEQCKYKLTFEVYDRTINNNAVKYYL